MVHEHLVRHLRVKVADVDLVVSAGVGPDCAHDVGQLSVVLGGRRVGGGWVPLVARLLVVLRVRPVLRAGLLHLLAWTRRRIPLLAGTMRCPVELEAPLSPRDSRPVEA